MYVNKDMGKGVIAFNSLKKYVGVFKSVTATAKFLGVTNAAVTMACNGHGKSCRGYYLRYYDNAALPDGKLTLQQYDKICGVVRSYYPNKKIRTQAKKMA